MLKFKVRRFDVSAHFIITLKIVQFVYGVFARTCVWRAEEVRIYTGVTYPLPANTHLIKFMYSFSPYVVRVNIIIFFFYLVVRRSVRIGRASHCLMFFGRERRRLNDTTASAARIYRWSLTHLWNGVMATTPKTIMFKTEKFLFASNVYLYLIQLLVSCSFEKINFGLLLLLLRGIAQTAIRVFSFIAFMCGSVRFAHDFPFLLLLHHLLLILFGLIFGIH